MAVKDKTKRNRKKKTSDIILSNNDGDSLPVIDGDKDGSSSKDALDTGTQERNKPARVDRFDLGRAIKLRYDQRLSYKEIGDILGVSKQAVEARISNVIKLLGDKDKIGEFIARESSILSNAREMLISAALDPDAIKKSSTLQLTTAYSQLFDKQRLIDGKSTSNVAYSDMTASEAEIEERIKQLSYSMGIQTDTTIYSNNTDIPDTTYTQVIDNQG